MNADLLPLLIKLQSKTITSPEFNTLKQTVLGIVSNKTLNSGLKPDDIEDITSAIWFKFCGSFICNEKTGVENLFGYFMQIISSCISDFFRKDDASLYKKTQNILKDSGEFIVRESDGRPGEKVLKTSPIRWEMARWFPINLKKFDIVSVDDAMFEDYSRKALSFEETIRLIDVKKKIVSQQDSIRDDETLLYFKGVFHDFKRLFNCNAGFLAAQLKELLAQKFWIEPHGKTSLLGEKEPDGTEEERYSASHAADGLSRQVSEFGISHSDPPDYFVERRLLMLIKSIENDHSQITPTHLWIFFVQLAEKREIPFVELSEKLKAIPELKHFGKSSLHEMQKLTANSFKKHGIEISAYSAGVISTVLKRYFLRKYGFEVKT